MRLAEGASLFFAIGTLLAAGASCSVADLTSGLAQGDAGAIGSSLAAVEGGLAGDSESGYGDAGARALDVALDASSWPTPTAAVRVRNVFNGKYLNASIPPPDASTFTPGVPVVTYEYTGATNQCFTFLHRTDDDTNEIITDTGLCLDDPYGDAATGTPMQQYQCWQGNNDIQNYNQRWYLVNNQGYLSIAGMLSGKCLTSTSDADGTPVYISDCSTSPSEQWQISNCP